jgi:hypothetical protein
MGVAPPQGDSATASGRHKPAYPSRMANDLKPIRQGLAAYEDGAHMYARFGVHWRAGAASLIPFGIIYFTTQDFGDAATTLTMGGYIIGPAVVALFATLWAVMSFGLLHRLRFDTRTWVHYTTYAIAGAVGLFLLAMASLALVQQYNDGTPDFWNAASFSGFLWASPLLGAISSIVGRRVLAPGIQWHVLIERPPLPDVFTYVDGKHDRDEFQRM